MSTVSSPGPGASILFVVTAFALVLGVAVAVGPIGALVATMAAAGAGAVLLAASDTASNRVLLGATMLLVGFTLPMNGLRVVSFLAVSDVLLVCAAVLLIVGRGRPPVPWGQLSLLLRGVVLLVAGGIVGALIGAAWVESIGLLLRFSLAAVTVLLVVFAWRPTFPELRGFLAAWVVGGTLSAVAGILWLQDWHGRALGFTPHSNHLALVSLLTLSVALGWVVSGSAWTRLAGTGAAAVLVAAVLLSGSRAAMVAAPVVFLAFVVLARSRAVLFTGIAIGLVVLSLLVAGFMQIPEQSALGRLFLNPTSSQQSDVERREALDETLESVTDSPLTGVGFVLARSAHNVALQVYASAGVLGLLGLAAIVLSVVLAVREAMRATAGPSPSMRQRRVVVASVGTALAGYAAFAMFQNPLWDRYIWAMVAVAFVLASWAPARQAPPRRVSA